MRICLLSRDHLVDGPAASGWGVAMSVRLLAGGLADAGHDVHVVAAAPRGRREFVDDGVRIHAIEVPDHWGDRTPELGEARSALSFAWHARRKVRALIASGGPFDVVDAPESGGQALFLASDADVRVTVRCHGHLLLDLASSGLALTPASALLADLEHEALAAAAAIHTASTALARRCAADYGLAPERFTHIPAGIDTRRFRPTASLLRQRLGLESARILLFVGRIEQSHGITTLVQAFAEVASALSDVVLLLVGPDVLTPPARASNVAWMCQQWESLGVSSDRYLFLGAVADAGRPEIYAAADVMVAPSPFETAGLAYLEAMACGCPPVGCLTGGAADVIEHEETGVLVPPGDPQALARDLIGLLEDPERRRIFAARGRQRVEHEHDLGVMVERTVRFYRETAACR